MPYEILNYVELSIPQVKKLLEAEIKKGDKVSELIQVVYEYAKELSHCPEDSAEKIMDELVNMGFKRITAAMIINIRPRIVDELRPLLVFESEIPEEEVLNKVLELLDKYCPLEK
ncbi:MAG: hypothetical protein DRO12_00795 [Thermoprotei archaeon]|nr:MAG: hypothetical protein DRO12_00795 [Thermoprotei archaeon]